MGTQFELPAEVTIYNAVETRDALLAWAAEQLANGSVELLVSARNVMEIDGAGLQLLVSLSNMDRSSALVDTSPALALACSTLGFDLWQHAINQKVAA